MLKEVLIKRSKGEELTDEEKELLKQYDESVLELNSKLKLLETEKELNTKKLETASEELQKKLKELENVSNELESTKTEKESFMKLLDDEKSSAKIKEELAKLEAEKKLKSEQEIKEKESKEILNRYEQTMKTLQSEMDTIKKQNDMFKFKYDISQKKQQYPYLEKEIDTILNEVEVKGIELSKQILEFLINSKNHDEEMKKYLAIKNAGSDIFIKEKKEQKSEQEEKIDPKYEKFKGLNIDLLKKYGFVSRR